MTPHLSELWDPTDDWTGLASATERKKRQDRLSQRACRKRRHASRMAALQVSFALTSSNPVVPTLPTRGTGHAQIELPKTSADDHLGFRLIRCHKTRERTVDFIRAAVTRYSLNDWKPSDLPTVSRLNLLNAFANNATLLGICFDEIYLGECASPFNLNGPSSPRLTSHVTTLPVTLRPTALQKSVVHHPWIDLVPIPSLRDNILQGIQTGVLDEEALCRDFGEIENAGENAPASVWGSSWSITSWEMSPRFMRKWGWLVQGCSEVVDSTNFWRQKRGEKQLGFWKPR